MLKPKQLSKFNSYNQIQVNIQHQTAQVSGLPMLNKATEHSNLNQLQDPPSKKVEVRPIPTIQPKTMSYSPVVPIIISKDIMAIIQTVLIAVLVYVLALLSGFHQVKQGYVGLYKKLGVLKPELSEPGFHFRIPFYEEFIEMKVSIQTDVVTNIPCGTSNGTLVYFDKVQVVNKLRKQYVFKTVENYTENYEKFWITDKLHHEINQFCSKHSLQEIYIDIFDQLDEELIESLSKDLEKWAPGIQLLSIRVTKPNIPERIKKNFEDMEKLKIDFFIAAEKEKVKLEEELTKQKQQVIKAESNLEVKKIDLRKMIEKKENDLKMGVIEGEMIFEKAKTQIETEFMAALEEAQSYPILFTDQYMSYLATDALTSNVTLVLGNQIPNIQLRQ